MMQPQVKPLARLQRTLVFIVLLLAFLFSLPAFIFYATGYRYDFTNDKVISATGGLYIQANAINSAVFINEVEVGNARLFRNASYIQGIEPGLKRVHVEAPGLNTWVKELHISPQIVTEAEAFNIPLIPQVRHITEYLTNLQQPVVFTTATSSVLFTLSSSTEVLFFATTTATSTYRQNREYSLMFDLFNEMASTTALREEQKLAAMRPSFGFSTTTALATGTATTTIAVTLATTTLEANNLRLYENGPDVYAMTLATGNRVPHFFCFKELPLLTTASGESEPVTAAALTNFTNCRPTIKLDRQGQEILGFAFYPQNNNLVLLHLTTGIYVVEIDDRAWQNSQLLYSGVDVMMLVYQGRIFIKEKANLFEVLTEIAVL
jgi:hypothetical protein